MIAFVCAAVAGYGTFLVVTWRWEGVGLGGVSRSPRPPVRDVVRALVPALLTGAAAGTTAFVVFGGVAVPLCAAACAAVTPWSARRTRTERRREAASASWPRLIEEIRLQATSLGRSIPQALFEAGRAAPVDLHAAFGSAERVWLVTTDFSQTIATLKRELDDAAADATLETLLVAHEVGGNDVDRRLRALADDRVRDLHDREEAKAKQAGVRFARTFVLVVPVGMAFAGLSIGSGRQAYASALGQLAVAIGIAIVAACWLWARRLMRMPQVPRVFEERS